MFTFPPSKWVGGILYEHGHRLIASTVGFFTIVLAAWLWLSEPRRWMKWLGVGALGAVIAQGVLGGLTVMFFLPAPISTAHAGLAEIFFCMTVAIALFTSPRWIDGGQLLDDAELRTFATTTTILIYCQILVGATMRHTGAGLAIPDFPLMFGHFWPTHWDAKIAIHFAHRAGAMLVATAVFATATAVFRRTIADYVALTKPRLNVLVVATSAAGFYLGASAPIDPVSFVATVVGTTLVASGAAALNQVYERHTDGLMQRTRLRPIPDGRISP